MSVEERFREKWLNIINENKPKIKKEKIGYNKSKILELENKIKKGIDELTFLNKNLDLLKNQIKS